MISSIPDSVVAFDKRIDAIAFGHEPQMIPDLLHDPSPFGIRHLFPDFVYQVK